MAAGKKRTGTDFAALLRQTLAEQAGTDELRALGLSVPDGGLRRDEAIAAAVVDRALRGDLAAVRFLRDAVGEVPAADAPGAKTEKTAGDDGDGIFRLELRVVEPERETP